MKRRRRYGEKYSGLPYPEDFKARMMALWPESSDLKKALNDGWDSAGVWFNELCSFSDRVSPEDILSDLNRGEEGLSELRKYCEDAVERRLALKALDDEWQRIVYLDDQGCKPWEVMFSQNGLAHLFGQMTDG